MFNQESGIAVYVTQDFPLDYDIVDVSIGTGSSVEFNFLKIWNYIKRKRLYDPYFDIQNLKFFHVHPPGGYFLSGTDLNCTVGFAQAFGEFGFYFSVMVFDNNKQYDLNGTLIVGVSKEIGQLVQQDSVKIVDAVSNHVIDYKIPQILKILSFNTQ